MKPESKAAARRRVKAAKRANAALRATAEPEFDNAPPEPRLGLGWIARWSRTLGLAEMIERVWVPYLHCHYPLGNAPPEHDRFSRHGTQGGRPVYDTRLQALIWLRRCAECEFGAILADLDDEIAAEEKSPTDIGWTEEQAAHLTRSRGYLR